MADPYDYSEYLDPKINPYTGNYSSYGGVPEWDWIDYLRRQQQSVTPNTPATPSQPAPAQPQSVVFSNRAPTQSVNNEPVIDIFKERNPGLSVTPGSFNYSALPSGGYDIGYNPEANSSFTAPKIAGALASLAPGGQLLGPAVEAAMDPQAYIDTKPVNIPGYGPLATSAGPFQAFMNVIPGASIASDIFGGGSLGNLASAEKEGRAVGRFGEFGSDIAALDPSGHTISGPFFGGSAEQQKAIAALKQQSQNKDNQFRSALAKNADINSRESLEARSEKGGGGERSGPIGGGGIGHVNEKTGTFGHLARGGFPRPHLGFSKRPLGFKTALPRSFLHPSYIDAGNVPSPIPHGGPIGSRYNRGFEGGTNLFLRQSQGAAPPPVAFAKGGEVSAPRPDSSYIDDIADGDISPSIADVHDALAQRGRGNDTMLAHVTPGEMMLPPEFLDKYPNLAKAILDAMQKENIDPTDYIVGATHDKNPKTGLSEYGFFKTLLKKIAPVGIGLGTSYLTGSDILGGLAGGVSSKLLGNDWLTAGLTGAGTGLASNLLGVSSNGGSGLFGPSGALGSLLGNNAPSSSYINSSAANPSISRVSAGGTSPISGASVASSGGGLFGGGGGLGQYILPVGLGAGAIALLSGLGGGNKPKSPIIPTTSTDPNIQREVAAQNAFNAIPADPTITINRTQTPPPANTDWYSFGQRPEYAFFKDTNPVIRGYASGGAVDDYRDASQDYQDANAFSGQVNGPGGGQDDQVPAMLSDGEFVIPADVVASLGDGSSKTGGKKLHNFMSNVRAHKAVKHHPPKAKKIMEYMG